MAKGKRASWLRIVVLGLAVALMSTVPPASAQAPPPPVIEGPVHSVIYVEVMPTFRADGATALRRYREAVLKEDGALRCEVVVRIGQPHQLAVLEVWRDQKAFDTHRAAPSAAQLRERIQPIRNAPIDERVHAALSVGRLEPGPGGDAIYVVTHVDVIPPRKDDAVVALKQLAEESRKDAGHVRFDVVQQTNRPNHFTVTEAWTSRAAFDTHAMTPHVRRFRDQLGPMSGSLYDERLYQSID